MVNYTNFCPKHSFIYYFTSLLFHILQNATCTCACSQL